MLKWTNLTLQPQGFYGALVLILAHLTFGFYNLTCLVDLADLIESKHKINFVLCFVF